MLQTVKAVFGPLLFLLGTQYASAQLDYVVKVPFTATETQTSTRDGKVTTETVALARSSDGSIYRSFSTKGKPDYRVTIDDVPNHRVIELDTQKQTYVIQPRPDLQAKTADDVEARIRSRRDEGRERASLARVQNNGEKHSNLGTKVEDGFTLYGWAVDASAPRKLLRGKPQPSLITHSETWSTDFGLDVSYDYLSYDEAHPDLPASTVREENEVTDLDLEEPDAALFKIPENYTLVEKTPPPKAPSRRSVSSKRK